MQLDDIQGNIDLDFHDILIDLLNSLTVVKNLSELDSYQKHIDEKSLVLNALNILLSNQDIERCSFFIKNEKGDLVNLTGLSSGEALSGKHKEHKPVTFKVGEGVIGLAAELGELQSCTDCKNDERFASSDNAFTPGSIISVPVMVLGSLFGVLNISHPEANYFSDWHIRLLEIYKNMLGQLISNFRMLKKMEHHVAQKTEHLERALAEAQELKKRYESLSMKDSLTSLYNRRFFYTQITPAIARTARGSGELYILLLDLDNFKVINDKYGHNSGDQVLVDVAKALNSMMRDTDLVARFGGEEFIVLFSQKDSAQSLAFAERIRKVVKSLHWVFEGKSVSISVSIGMYCISKNTINQKGEDIDAFIHYADLAMYQAKSKGKNQVVQFTESLLENAV